MFENFGSTRSSSRPAAALALLTLALVVACSVSVFAQTTISTGSIQGTVTDPSGAAVSGAKVTITGKGTGKVSTVETNSAGLYVSGALTPGDYTVRIEAQGFKTLEKTFAAQVGVTTPGDLRLQVGQASQIVQVEGSELQVNTEQVTVQGVLTPEQIDNLPINGRNFLDLAQLEPGVQIQDGGDFDPTKKGFSSISFGGRFGRTARIEIDGVDSSDETVGTTTQDIPLGAIQEFQIGESMLDLSTELTSSGAVNVVTKSGTNSYHGSAYYNFRDQSLNADLPGGTDTYFQRNQVGGNLGGWFIKDKLFFFGDIEHNKQGFEQPVLPLAPFDANTGTFGSPFHETEGVGRLDYQISKVYHLFYRFSDNKSSDVTAYVPASFQPLNNTNRTHDHVVGLDFTTGSFTHSIRFGYMKFQNHIASGTVASTPFNPSSPIELAIGPDPLCINISGATPDPFCSGQGFLAPQTTPQSDHQIKYDGSKPIGKHVIRYGGGFNHIQGGGYAGFLADGPSVNDPNPGDCPGAPLTCLATNVLLSNGIGFSTEKAAFGFAGGGLGPDNRFYWYAGDSWKLKSNFTVTYGLRYVRDTGRTDSDLPPIPALSQDFDNQFYSNLGARVNNPNKNFAPQLGIAWDPWSSGKTVFRGGIGIFYENSIWNNVLFDRPARLTNGAFLGFQPSCTPSGPVTYTLPGTTTSVTPTYCGETIATAQAAIAAAQAQYQAAAASVGAGPNSGFIGTALEDTGPNGTSTNLFYPGYRTPRSVQMNFGVQHEIRRGTVLTADYLRNISTHTLLAVDTNHVGDARFGPTYSSTSLAAAQNAIALTTAGFGCPGGYSASAINCAIGAGATIVDFAGAQFAPDGTPTSGGLDSGYDGLAGGPAANVCGGPSGACLTPSTGAAFPGINPNVGGNQMLFPSGRSTYNGLQMSLKQDLRNPFKGIPLLNLQVSYALSRYRAMAQDSDFVNSAWDYAAPTKFMGPDALDRTDQISFGGTMELPFHFRANIIGHFYSPLPTTLFLSTTGLPGGIFVTGVNGDGQGDGYLSNGSNGGLGGILPGQNLGSFGRGVNGSNINNVINAYNQKYAGQPTPAGQALIAAGLFTQTQLSELGGVMPTVLNAPANQASNGWLHDLDLSLNWTYKIAERVALTPGVGFFNVTNFANFDGPKNSLSGQLALAPQTGFPGTTVVPGSVNTTSGQQPDSLRVGLGSGVFGLGSPRVVEFSLKVAF